MKSNVVPLADRSCVAAQRVVWQASCALAILFFVGSSGRAAVAQQSAAGPTERPAPDNSSTASGDVPAELNDLAAKTIGARLRFENDQVLISHIRRGGPAERAGIRPGDRLISIENHKVNSLADVSRILKHFQPGHGVVMSVEPKAGPRQLYVGPQVRISSMTSSGGAMLGINPYLDRGAVVVGELSQGGPAAVAGLRTDDRIVSVDGEPIASPSQLVRIVRNHRPGDRIDVLIARGGWQRTALVTLGSTAEVGALPEVKIPGPTAAAETAAPAVGENNQPSEWVGEVDDASDIYNVNQRALYSDFD